MFVYFYREIKQISKYDSKAVTTLLNKLLYLSVERRRISWGNKHSLVNFIDFNS